MYKVACTKKFNLAAVCYEKLKQIPLGFITTYKILADSAGSKAYRAVGTALSKNPEIPAIPCHRVICSDGRVGQYVLGSAKKISLLQSEGVVIENGKVVDFERKLWRFEV